MSKACPIHSIALAEKPTRFGIRYSCPREGCTVACWSGDTSTPADAETRAVRIQAHGAFDAPWKSGKVRRTALYRRLSEYLGVPVEKTHIGMFDRETCLKVLEFAAEVINECCNNKNRS